MVKGGNPRLDQYVPTELRLAMHELVQGGGLADFSFRTTSDLLRVSVFCAGGSNQCKKCKTISFKEQFHFSRHLSQSSCVALQTNIILMEAF